MSKYKVAEGFAFTAGGVVYAEGDEISLEQFGGNEAAFSVVCEKGLMERVRTKKTARRRLMTVMTVMTVMAAKMEMARKRRLMLYIKKNLKILQRN